MIFNSKILIAALFFYQYLTALSLANVEYLHSKFKISIVICDVINDENEVTLSLEKNSSLTSKIIQIKQVLFSSIEAVDFERILRIENNSVRSFFREISLNEDKVFPHLSLFDPEWELTSGKHCLVIMFSPLPIEGVPFIVLGALTEKEFNSFIQSNSLNKTDP